MKERLDLDFLQDKINEEENDSEGEYFNTEIKMFSNPLGIKNDDYMFKSTTNQS